METTMDGSDLSKRQKAILDYIVASVNDRGFPPSVREIGEAVGLASPSTVHAHLHTLEEKGYLRRDPTKPRAIDVRWERESRRVAAQSLPIYGSIAAGPTSLAEQEHEGDLAVPEEFIDDTPHFVLRVKGDSMIEAGIHDGDYVVVRTAANPTNGDIIAAQVEGPSGEAEVTVKRLRREGGKVILVPANPTMAPFEAPADVRVLGRVVGLLRRL
ncbi:MAG TPA: transcriptional repressor LexA [Actinomycetota bacterium]|nr:transcriptional repressor LexA [Actinomycetota bacterium]